MMKKKSRLFCPGAWALLALTAAIVLCWCTGMGWSEWTFDNLLYNGLDFGDAPSKTFALEEGTPYGAVSRGPNYSLAAGTYRLSWTAETKEENYIRIVTSNGARVEPAQIAIRPDTWADSCSFTLLDDAENLEILVCYENGPYLKLHDVSLSFACSDGLWMMTLLTAALALGYILDRRGYLTAERKKILLIIGAAVLISSVPALRENLNAGHDSEFHRMRLRNVVSALGEGQLPVRVGGSMYNGYGSAASVFYPDFCFYIPALMMLGGATIQFAVSVLIIGLNAVSAATMYACARRMAGSRAAGVIAAVLYALTPYRLTDVYVRAAFGEAAAMAVLPLFVLGLWEVVFGDRDRWYLLALGAFAVFMTHMLSTVLCAALAAVVLIARFTRIIKEGRLPAIFKAAGLTVLMSLFYLVPLLDYLTGGISMGSLNSSVGAAAMEPIYLFASDSAFPRDIGPAMLIGAVTVLYLLMGRKDSEAVLARTMLLAGAAFALLSTNLFPWALIEERLTDAVNFLQFPWRLLAFADIGFALGCGIGLSAWNPQEKVREIICAAVLLVCVIASAGQISQYTVAENAPQRYWLSNSHMIGAYSEYTLKGSNVSRTVGEHEVLLSGGVQMTQYEKDGTRIEAQVSAAEGGEIAFPLFGFDGYAAELNGERIYWRRGENNRLTVDVPAGTQGTLRVWFAGNALWRIADIVSLISGAALLFFVYRRRKGECHPHQQKQR